MIQQKSLQEYYTQRPTAAPFCLQAGVHVNHLNRSLKEATGKTTTEHIACLVIAGAIALLKHTDWNIAQTAYCLNNCAFPKHIIVENVTKRQSFLLGFNVFKAFK